MKLEEKFLALKVKKEGAFMPYVCCGDPDAEFTLELVRTLVKGGADILEFGIPFSDPIADGPSIQKASTRAIKNGMTPPRAIELLEKVCTEVDIPVVVMTYFNPVFRMGVDSFVSKIAEAGASGLLVPDLPLEETGETRKIVKSHGLDFIMFATPTTTDERLAAIAAEASGFIYLVATEGTTGARDTLENKALKLIKRVKEHSELPVAVGFGIAKPEHAQEVIMAGADGAIVGSRIIDLYEGSEKVRILNAIEKYSKSMKEALSKGF